MLDLVVWEVPEEFVREIVHGGKGAGYGDGDLVVG